MKDFCTSENGAQRIVSDVAASTATPDAAFAPDQTSDETIRAISNGATGVVAPAVVGALDGTALNGAETQGRLTRLAELPELEGFEIKADSNGHVLYSHWSAPPKSIQMKD